VTTQAASAWRRLTGRHLVRTVVQILVILIIGTLAVWKLDLGKVRDAFQIHSWTFLVAAVLANFASVGFKGVAWKGVVDALPSVTRRTRYRDLIGPLFVSFLFNARLAARVGVIV
jgi:hypothetical protein